MKRGDDYGIKFTLLACLIEWHEKPIWPGCDKHQGQQCSHNIWAHGPEVVSWSQAMGTTGRFGKSNSLLRRNNQNDPNCIYKFLFNNLQNIFNLYFPFAANFATTDNSEIFFGFLVVLIFFLSTIVLFCLLLFIFWLKDRLCPRQALLRRRQRQQRRRRALSQLEATITETRRSSRRCKHCPQHRRAN